MDIALVVYVMFTLCTMPFRGASIFSYAIFVVVIKSLISFAFKIIFFVLACLMTLISVPCL